MISHRDLQGLAGLADYFPLIGDYLRGATTEVQFETDRGDQFRTHIIVDAALFPSVMIAVEGSDSAVVARRFFALPELDFAHFCVLGRRSADRPEDVLCGDEVECPVDRELGRAERSGCDPAFLPERPIEHVEAAFGVGRPQPGDRCAGTGII